MPTVSVKLSDATREHVQVLARARGVTPHAVMVEAIESAITQAQAQDTFIQRALQARAEFSQTGRVMEPDAFADYLKGKAQGKPRRRPQAVNLDQALKTKP